jgi:hypothetical protein
MAVRKEWGREPKELSIDYITDGGRGHVDIDLRGYFPMSATWLRKFLRLVVDRSTQKDELRREIYDYLKSESLKVPDPESVDFLKACAKDYSDTREKAADCRKVIEDWEKRIPRMEAYVKGMPKKCPERELIKDAKEKLRQARRNKKNYEKKAEGIAKLPEQYRKDREEWAKLLKVLEQGG